MIFHSLKILPTVIWGGYFFIEIGQDEYDKYRKFYTDYKKANLP